jgi:hypothetical protein
LVINILYDTNIVPVEVELYDEDLASFLKCDGIKYKRNYYKITNKIYEFSSDALDSITVIAKSDSSIAL